MLKRLTDRTTTLGYEGLALRLGIGLYFLMYIIYGLEDAFTNHTTLFEAPPRGIPVSVSVLGLIVVFIILAGYRTRFCAAAVFLLSTGWVILSAVTGNFYRCGYVLTLGLEEIYTLYLYFMASALILFIWGGGACSIDSRGLNNCRPELTGTHGLIDKIISTRDELPATVVRMTYLLIFVLYLADTVYRIHLCDPFPSYIFKYSAIRLLFALCIAGGILTRPASLAFVLWGSFDYIRDSILFESWFEPEAIIPIFVFVALTVTGGGRYSFDRWIITKRAAKAGG